MIFSIALGALSIFRGFQQAQAQERQADIAEQNAQYASELAVNNAEIEKQNNQLKKESQYESYRRRRAIQEASYATSGVLLDGTPSQYLQAQVETDELNLDRQDQASYQRQLGILYKGQQERSSLLAQADAYRSSADASILGGFMGAGATMMTAGIGDKFPWMQSGKTSTASNLSADNSSSLLGGDLSKAYEPLTLGGR
jgi:sucrose-6-phosphate hydrolase SacC (GH32 family)